MWNVFSYTQTKTNKLTKLLEHIILVNTQVILQLTKPIAETFETNFKQ